MVVRQVPTQHPTARLKEPVSSGEPHAAGACPFQDLELMSQCENLKLQGSPISERRAHGHEQRDDDGSHRRRPYLRKPTMSMFSRRTEFLVGRTPPIAGIARCPNQSPDVVFARTTPRLSSMSVGCASKDLTEGPIWIGSADRRAVPAGVPLTFVTRLSQIPR